MKGSVRRDILLFDMGVGHAGMFIFNHTLIICIFYVCILYFKNIFKISRVYSVNKGHS